MARVGEIILEHLKTQLEELEELEVMLQKAEEGEADRDVLTTLHPDFGLRSNIAETEYYFLEKEEIGVDLFVVQIRIASGIPSENAEELCTAISLVNPGLLGGGFAFDPFEENLQYLLKVPITEDSTGEQILSLAVVSAAAALSEAEEYAEGLIRLGRMGGGQE